MTDSVPQSVLLVGTPAALRRLEAQLDLLDTRPVTIGWVVTTSAGSTPDDPILGDESDLESIVATRRPPVALIALPAAMSDGVQRLRTRLRRLGVAERFMPTLEDQLAGVGPRSRIDVDPAALLDRPPRPIDTAAVRRLVAGRRVLITGAGGSIGSELARVVAPHAPAALVLMDRSENALFEIDRQIARVEPKLARHAILHDVVDEVGTLDICRTHRPDLIVHAAAHKHVPMMEEHPGAAVDNNLFGTKAIVDAADATGTDQFVMISTDKAVNPTSIMGATKRLAELYVQSVNRTSATACSMVRFGNVLGSSGSVLDVWAHQVSEGGPVTVTDPRMTRYFMTIREAASLVLASATLVDRAADWGEIFLLDMGDPVRILDMVERYVRLHGLAPALPDAASRASDGAVMPIVFTGARPGEKLHEELAFDAERMRATAHPHVNLWMTEPPDPALIKDVLGALAPEHRDPDPRAIADIVRRHVPEMQVPTAA